MSRRVFLSRRVLALVAAIAPGLGCGAVLGLDDLKDRNTQTSDGGTTDAGADVDGRPSVPVNPDAVGASTATKVDLLLVVDDSAAMADKQQLLADALPAFLNRLADATEDIHVGVIGTSLGGMGGDVCSNLGAQNGRARLRTTGLATKAFVAFETPSQRATNITDVVDVVLGMGEKGCGLEAQLESAYRFLVQPDPWDLVKVASGRAEYDGIDAVVLTQRRAFLRPDSLVVVLLLTDEDDSTVDPRSLGGTGWAFVANQYPGSTTTRADGVTTTAPRPTTACASTPGSPDCRSCAFGATCDVADPACAKVKRDPSCQGPYGIYYGPREDLLNARFHRMKQRYGVDPQFPIARYVDGFTKERVPNRDEEHVRTEKDGKPFLEEYGGAATCTNPLFAAALPGSTDDRCHLPRGPRGKELVMFGVLGGVPDKLVRPLDWTKVLGAEPATFDTAGQDPHMNQSTLPRPGLPPVSATRGDNGTDLTHGREWETSGNDLQYACTFALAASRVCTSADTSCDCAEPLKVPPLCGPTVGEQVAAKAYPSIRPLRVVKDLGARGLVGSVCAHDVGGFAATMRATMTTLAARITPRIVK